MKIRPSAILHDRSLSTLRFLTVILILLAGAAWLGVGALEARHRFLTRGMLDALAEPTAHAGVRLGINADLNRYADGELPEELAQMAAVGVTAVKQPFYFHRPFDWSTAARLVTAVEDSGLALVPVLDGDPADSFAPPADPAAFAAWTGEFAARFGPQLQAYIIWDEPNLTSHWGGRPVNANDYAALLAAAAQSIRSADPGAVIVAAPLAPTIETGPQNLADPLYLQALYEAGAAPFFDVAAGKPYGFDAPPFDRTVDRDVLNFSRLILLREVMVRNDDGAKALWAGNWGWNSLPTTWTGRSSIWGQVDEAAQAEWTLVALDRARQEWPWLGLMFLENWEPSAAAQSDDPHWGFSIAGRQATIKLAANQPTPDLAYPGFHLAQPEDPAQEYTGLWRFSPEFGADIGATGDRLVFHFWGTDIGLRVRRADFRARLYATVDGRPANALPRDENGAALVLTSPDPAEDYLIVEPIARNLEAGSHTLELVAERGWDQWALNGFSVAYRPSDSLYNWGRPLLALLGAALLVLAWITGRQAAWGETLVGPSSRFRRLGRPAQWALTALAAALVSAAGFLTWGLEGGSIYRRLGDSSQLALTAAAASLFYVTPSFILYLAALAALFLLIYLRPAWGLALVAFSFPFYLIPKPMLGYRFSPVELFLLVTLAGAVAARLSAWRAGQPWPAYRRHPADYPVLALVLVASVSLFFTDRLDVATNEWRVVVVEPALFYFLFRWMPPTKQELWAILDAFLAGGLLVALIGLAQVITGRGLITAEGGLPRLRAFFGSPNNVALYLGRVLPLAAAVPLLGNGRRRTAYALAALPLGLAMLLTFSKGAVLLGLPAAALALFILWRRTTGRSLWRWVAVAAVLGAVALLGAFQVPSLAARLDPQGQTGFFRLNLWRASLQMIRQHPWFGVGLDNFLYAYRGRYILDAAWREPNLNHPHNLFLDFATRLGLLGLGVGLWLFAAYGRTAWRAWRAATDAWRPVAAAALTTLVYILVHGLVDHSFFLIDLAFAFFLWLGILVWLAQSRAHS